MHILVAHSHVAVHAGPCLDLWTHPIAVLGASMIQRAPRIISHTRKEASRQVFSHPRWLWTIFIISFCYVPRDTQHTNLSAHHLCCWNRTDAYEFLGRDYSHDSRIFQVIIFRLQRASSFSMGLMFLEARRDLRRKFTTRRQIPHLEPDSFLASTVVADPQNERPLNIMFLIWFAS